MAHSGRRNDGTKVYLLSTAENDRFGGWNAYRPFIYDLTSGNVQLGGDGNEDALTLERASRAARFSNDVYIKKGHLTFGRWAIKFPRLLPMEPLGR
ncbi:hypothetical protein QT332_08040 [Escherichia coli]|nr:hypothetical protein [Escherichia coli]MDM4918066.1 hypothetical protein [Escherichia coli]